MIYSYTKFIHMLNHPKTPYISVRIYKYKYYNDIDDYNALTSYPEHCLISLKELIRQIWHCSKSQLLTSIHKYVWKK